MTRSPLPAPGAPLDHYVSDAPFDPYSVEKMTPEQERVFRASQLRLTWWKFKRHKLAVVHVSAREKAREAVNAGVDGLVHIFFDQQIDQILTYLKSLK